MKQSRERDRGLMPTRRGGEAAAGARGEGACMRTATIWNQAESSHRTRISLGTMLTFTLHYAMFALL